LTDLIKARFDEATHTYVDSRTGQQVPSVTTIRDYWGFGLDYGFVKDEVMEYSRDLGNAVDEAISLTENGYQVDADTRVLPYLDGYLEMKEKTKWVPWMIHNGDVGPAIADVDGMPVGFCTDQVGSLDGEETILELKRTTSVGPGAGFQTAGYDLCLAERRRLRAVFQLLPGKFRLWTSRDKDSKVFDQNDYAMFRYSLAMTYFQVNKGMLKIGEMRK
jgi:hypothetical protein